MLEIKIKNNGEMEVDINGSPVRVTADAITAVRGIYRAIKEKSETRAEEFKADFVGAINDNLPFMTDEEEEEFFKEDRKKAIEKMPEEIKTLIDSLQALADKLNIDVVPVAVNKDQIEKIQKIVEEDNPKENVDAEIKLENGETITVKLDDGGNNQCK